jgi:hypothetical protein
VFHPVPILLGFPSPCVTQNWIGMVANLISDHSEQEQEMHQKNFDLCGCYRLCCSCVVGLKTKVWAGWSEAKLPAGWRDFSLLQKCPDTSSLLFSGNGGTISVWEWLRHDADYTSPSSATVDNEWSYSTTLLECLHCTHQGTSYLTCFNTLYCPFCVI